jgi:predicted helicase
MSYLWHDIYNSLNYYITIPGLSSPKEFHSLASKHIIDLNCLPAGCQCLPIYCYDKQNNQIENITDWGLQQFHDHYNDSKITKEDIFHYVYAVLHNPEYRIKYELNLKRDFPRIPFYNNFYKWAAWGKALMDLHINYENEKLYPLKEINLSGFENLTGLKAKLKADKETGAIILDEATSLTGIPAEAWQYKLGNRSALEWVLDQYKEKKPTDPTIAEKFNTYRFADYKIQVIDLLKRICTVSVETMKIIDKM